MTGGCGSVDVRYMFECIPKDEELTPDSDQGVRAYVSCGYNCDTR
jgi:hypothetical protein